MAKLPKCNEPPLRAVPMSLFPTMDSLQEVIELGYSKVPIQNRNDVYSLLMIFQNTLIKTMKE